ncbi:MAG TPA: DEAD/DEAH box helicase family protein [Candidatus Dojkabacteria bacterium]|nr:DEAD/DEAH box helicase family protein [Candidatus Dojkabacteria bacterium]
MIKLRPYQTKAVSIINSKDRGLISIGTGGGKTSIMTAVAKEKTLVLCHTQALLIQLADRFSAETSYKIGQLYQNSHDFDYDVLISTWQSMRILIDSGKIDKNAFNMILVDECHNAVSDEYRSVIEWFICNKLFGFTATWQGKNQDKLLALFGQVIFEKTLFDLIDEGYLTKLKFFIHIDDIPTKDKTENLAYQYKKWTSIEGIVNRKQAKVIHFFSKVKDFQATPFDDYHPISFDVSLDKRQEIFNQFNNPDSGVDHLFSCRILNEGIDLPIANTLIFHENVGGFRTFNQRLGRGARLHETKEWTDVVMFINSANEEQMLDVTNFIDEVKECQESKKYRESEKKVPHIEIILLERTEEFINKMRSVVENRSLEVYTLEEARDVVKKMGIKTTREYRYRYKEDPRLPASIEAYYKISWNKLIGKEYYTLDEACIAVKKLGITKSSEYILRYKEDPKLPASIEGHYKISWNKFIGKEYYTLDEAYIAVKKLGITKRLEYILRYKEDPRLPASIETYYKISWKKFMTLFAYYL